MLHLETAGLSDIGKKRDHQEDAFLVDDEHRLYVVADGMGGPPAGEVASAIIIETLQAAVSDPDDHLPPGTHSQLSPEAARLAAWILHANRNIFEQSQNRLECRGMGSTIAALYYADKRVVAANVGDSPAYLIREGSIELISAIHNLASDEAARNLYGRDMPPHLFNHMLTRAVGIANDVQPCIRELTCRAGDCYSICSDGLSNAVTPAEMLAIVGQYSAHDACTRLIDLANARGGEDNSTVIVIKVQGYSSDNHTIQPR
jgi:protein phosphatase